MPRKTIWTLKNDFIAFMLAKTDTDKQEIKMQARVLKISVGSLQMRVDNYRYLISGSGLSNSSKQSLEIYKKYKDYDLRSLYQELNTL